MSDCTHVIEWMPGWTLVPPGEGFWEDFLGGTPRDTRAFRPDGACVLTDEDLAGWAEGVLGFPVALTASTVERRAHRFWGRWHCTPVYYVRRAS